jgi:hypothetical protein
MVTAVMALAMAVKEMEIEPHIATCGKRSLLSKERPFHFW